MTSGHVDAEVKLLQAQGVHLRDRIDGMTEELSGKAHQLKAMMQEVTIYGEAVSGLIKAIRTLEIQNAAKDEQLKEERQKNADKDMEIESLKMLLSKATAALAASA